MNEDGKAMLKDVGVDGSDSETKEKSILESVPDHEPYMHHVRSSNIERGATIATKISWELESSVTSCSLPSCRPCIGNKVIKASTIWNLRKTSRTCYS